MFPSNKKLFLIYRGSRDSFKADVYHQKVDNKGPFVVLVLSENNKQIFGGYSDLSERESEKWTIKKGNGNSFLFKFKDNNFFEKLKCK